MVITIANKDYELRFGFDYIEYINKVNSMEAQGINLSIGGMKFLMVGIQDKTPSSLRRIIRGATITERSQPSNANLDSFIEELIESGEYDDFYDSVILEMGKHSLVLKEMGITKEQWQEALMQEEMKKALNKN